MKSARNSTMTLREHLKELNRRLLVSACAIVLAALAGWFASDALWSALRAPVLQLSNQHLAQLNYQTVSSAFDLRIQIAITIGIVLSSPVWLYQVFAFLIPAMARREIAYVLGFVGVAVPLFLAGAFAGWTVVPHIVQLLLSFVPSHDASFIDAKTYFDFVLKLVVATGIAFVLPVFLVMLNFAGILAGRTILNSWRWALIAIFTFTAIATPSADVLAMMLLAAPMIALYLSSACVGIIHDRLVRRRLSSLEGSKPSMPLSLD